MNQSFPPIDFTRIDLMDLSRTFATRIIPACTNHFRGSKLTCCPYCGTYTIRLSERMSQLSIRVDLGTLTVIWFCCDNCHTHYYVPLMLVTQHNTFTQTQLVATLKKYEDKRRED